MEYKIMMTAIIIMLFLTGVAKFSAEVDLPYKLVGVLSMALLASAFVALVSSIAHVWAVN